MDDQFALAEMMAPLPDGAGADLRGSGPGSDLYLNVKDRRAAARLAERDAIASGEEDVEPLEAGLSAWRDVATEGRTLLGDHAKDLQVAAWICEAWLRTDGLPGLADGFSLLAELVERYWEDGLYPAIDEEGDETRLASLFGLFGREDTGTLIQPIKLLPLTDAPGERVALWSLEAIRAQAVRHDDPEVREQLVERRADRIAALEGAVAAASADFVAVNVDAIEHALAELGRLMDAIAARTDHGRFGSQVAEPLEAMLTLLRTLRPAAAPPADTGDAIDPQGSSPPIAGRAATPRSGGGPQSREAAYATLLEIADYFDTAEPHSLIGKGLRDIVRRAKLPLEGLLAELLPDAEQRRLFLLRAGIRDETEAESYSSY